MKVTRTGVRDIILVDKQTGKIMSCYGVLPSSVTITQTIRIPKWIQWIYTRAYIKTKRRQTGYRWQVSSRDNFFRKYRGEIIWSIIGAACVYVFMTRIFMPIIAGWLGYPDLFPTLF